MKRIKRMIAAASAAVVFNCGNCLYPAAVSVNDAALPVGQKNHIAGGASFSVPHFGIDRELGKGEIVQIPSTGKRFSHESQEYLPESFSLYGTETLTPVRDQSGFGTCWAHSAIASAESSIAARVPGVDLSEFHTSYYVYSGGDQLTRETDSIKELMDLGGNCFYAAALWSQWIGPVSEKRLRYGDTGFFDDDGMVSAMKYAADHHMRNAYVFDFDDERSNADDVKSLVKEFVYSGLAVDVSFYSDSLNCYSSELNSTNSRRTPGFANHSVVIAGWDDNFPAENFLIPAENDGAWLVKNSWGADFGEEGFMWISYEDRSLSEFSVFELEDAEEYTVNFFHDTYIPLQSMSAYDDPEINQPSYAANVFKADETVQIEAVSTYIGQPGTEYEITVYTGLTDMEDPTSGVRSGTTRGVCRLTGFQTIDLDADVIVNEGESFAVVAKLYCPDSPFVIPIEGSLFVTDDVFGENFPVGNSPDHVALKEHTGAKESFYSSDGMSWEDMIDGDYQFTEEEEQEILEQFEKELFDGIEPYETELLAEAQERLDMIRELFSLGTASLAVGNISLKALGNPVNTVDFSLPSGRVMSGEKVELSVKNGEEIRISVNGGGYMRYTGPITITELTEISATTDNVTYTSRTYLPTDFAGIPGDADGNGASDAADASLVLADYAAVSSGGKPLIGRFMTSYADINEDCVIDASDASAILELYAMTSTSSGKQT